MARERGVERPRACPGLGLGVMIGLETVLKLTCKIHYLVLAKHLVVIVIYLIVRR